MEPTVIEVDAEKKDMLDDMLRIATIAVMAFVLHFYVFKTPGAQLMDAAAQSLIITLLGIGSYHLIVKSSLLKFVVKRGQENYYANIHRYT
jgi:hypothetical protein